jgi:hypothetical protein
MNDMTKQVAEAVQPQPTKLAPVIDTSEFAELLDSNRFGQIQRVAKLFSESDLVPEIFQGKPANCAVALQMAFRLRVDPMMLMQNMYIVHGRPGIEAKLAIALMNQRGPFTGPLQWKFEGQGDKKQCTCFATHRQTGEQCKQTVTFAMVKAEGWLDKSGSKWKTMPDIMFQYRSAMFLGRLYCPEVLLGLPTDDELRDVGPRLVGVGGGSDDIQMPRALETPAEPKAATAPIDVDPATGETSAPAGKTIEPGETADMIGQGAPGKADTSAGDTGKVNAAALGKKASDAQRKMIIDIAKRAGVTVAQLDERLIEKFSMGIDELPMGLVSDATQLVRGLSPASSDA